MVVEMSTPSFNKHTANSGMIIITKKILSKQRWTILNFIFER